MSDNGSITYSYVHVYHIIQILQINLAIIHDLIRMIEAAVPHLPMDTVFKTASDEIATCIRILDMEGVHA